MSCFGKKKTSDDVENEKVSKNIEAQIKEDRKKESNQIKLLLLGTGASGKSTFLKQLKVLHKEGFSATEIEQFKESLPMNAVQSMQKLVQAFLDGNNKSSSKTKAKMDKLMETSELTDELANIIKELWDRDDIKDLFERRNETNIQVESAAPYYFENVGRFANPDFTPTQEDMLRARIKTTGIRELRFTIKDIEFTIVDVGGQRSERRKWIHCFDNVTSIIYLAALDEYDMKLEEDNRTNRLEESLQLFGEVSGSQFFAEKEISWILFLNKSDLLKEKIKQRPINIYFKEYPADKAQDFDTSVKFIQDKYEKKYRGGTALYPYTTCAIDTQNCEKVFSAVRDTVLTGALEEAGF